MNELSFESGYCNSAVIGYNPKYVSSNFTFEYGSVLEVNGISTTTPIVSIIDKEDIFDGFVNASVVQ